MRIHTENHITKHAHPHNRKHATVGLYLHIYTDSNITIKVNFSPQNCFFGRTFPFPCLSYGPINYSQVIFSSVSQTLYHWSTPYSSILSTLALWSLILFLLSTCQPSDGHFYSRLRPLNISTNKFTLPPSQLITFPYLFPYVSVCLMSYDVWLFAPTYACISTKLSLYWVNKALSLHNILVFSFHAYRTKQMSMNGETKNTHSQKKSYPTICSLTEETISHYMHNQ